MSSLIRKDFNFLFRSQLRIDCVDNVFPHKENQDVDRKTLA